MKDQNATHLLLDLNEKNFLRGGIIVGNRIPKDYFITKGTGQSDITIHAGSYHLALKDAGIEMANIMTYSSILPSIANKVDKPGNITHGAVMESIMSSSNGGAGERCSAGIIYSWLTDRKTNARYGGLVCEHYGNYPVEELEYRLRASLDELYYNGFEENFAKGDTELIMESFVPEKIYGTALVAICFTNYLYPIIG